MSLEKLLYMNELFSIYQSLLTDKQQEMLSLYYQEDYSLAEIAEHYQISRQGVFDNIRRGEEALELYEEKLKLLSLKQQRLQLFEQIKKENHMKTIQAYIDQLIDLE